MSKRKAEPETSPDSSKRVAATGGSTNASSPNEDICRMLNELAEYEKNVNRQMFKHNVYRKAAAAIQKLPSRLSNAEDAKQLPGVGEKIAKKIGEFLATGHLAKLDVIKQDDTSVAIQELTRVSGIGPVAARKFVDQGVTTVEQLSKHVDQLTHHQQIGLKYVTEFEVKIPRAEMLKLAEVIQAGITAVDKQLTGMVCGSFRRGKATSGDIDVLLTHPHYKSDDPMASPTKPHGGKPSKPSLLTRLVTQLEKDGFITDTLSHGDTKFMGVCKLTTEQLAAVKDKIESGNSKDEKNDQKQQPLHRRIDLRLIPYDQYWCGVLYFTGSDQFNRDMRTKALSLGYTLNEFSLRKLGATGKPGESLPVTSERDVFDYLEMDFKEPTDRV